MQRGTDAGAVQRGSAFGDAAADLAAGVAAAGKIEQHVHPAVVREVAGVEGADSPVERGQAQHLDQRGRQPDAPPCRAHDYGDLGYPVGQRFVAGDRDEALAGWVAGDEGEPGREVHG